MAIVWLASDVLLHRRECAQGVRVPVCGKRKRAQPLHTEPAERDNSFSIHGVARLSQGNIFDGPLTEWPRDAWIHHMHLGELLDAYTLKVEGVFRFADPVEIEVVRARRQFSCTPQGKRRICEPVVPVPSWSRWESSRAR